MTTPHQLTETLLRCAEVRQSWADRPENQRPPVTNRHASDTWWQRWNTSQEKAHCDQLLRGVMESTAPRTARPTTTTPNQ